MQSPQSFRPTTLNEMVISSVDTLRETEIDQSIPATWNDKPPLLNKVGRNGVVIEETENLLKGMIRQGIPPALRCAIQLSNIIQRVHTQNTAEYWHEYRTLAKIRVLDYAYDSLLHRILTAAAIEKGSNSTCSDKDATVAEEFLQQNNDSPMNPKYDSQWESMDVSYYGRPKNDSEKHHASHDNLRGDITTLIPGTTILGQLAVKRVLMAIEQCIGVEYAPLIPVITSILLTSMSESYAFTALREMGHYVTFYFPSSRIEHMAWCFAFGDILKKLHPQTASYLDDRGVLDIDGLKPMFQNFFVDVLPFQYVQRIMDIYTFEGSKVLFRVGVALLVLYKVVSSEQLLTISNADEWWHTMKLWTYSSKFNFEFVVRKAYGVHGNRGGLRGQLLRFPRRAIIQRIIRMEEDRIMNDEQYNEDGIYQEPPARPLGLVRPQPLPPDAYGNPGEEVRAILVESVQLRQYIAQWLPLTLRLTDLNLLYSTNFHGRTLERFYEHVKYAKNTLVICEVLLPQSIASSKENNNEVPRSCTVGMYASQNWHISTRVYGDGDCFLFRLEPNSVSWKWQPNRVACLDRGTSILDHVELDIEENNSNDSSNNRTALLEQFMVGTKDYISMGGNPDGTCGLRINEDLTKGESSKADGFNNEPLHHCSDGESSSMFEIGLVEVYGFVRQIDGRPV
jgi:TBC1 domain family member 24